MKIKLVFFILAASIYSSFGSSVIGGYLLYKLIPGDSAEFTLVQYRDCTGLPLNASPTITLSQGSIIQNITTTRISIIDKSNVCASVSSVCKGGNVTGYEEITFRKAVSLSSYSANSLIKVSFQECCISGIVSTLVSPGNYYIETSFMKGVSGNESPIPMYPSPLTVPSGILNGYNIKARNASSDSIVYQFGTPLSSASTSYQYTTGYSATKPFAYNGSIAQGLTINQTTGSFMVGNQEGITFIGATGTTGWLTYYIHRYRSGNLLGSTMFSHHIQIISNSTSNTAPKFVSGDASYKVCAGTQLCFDVLTADDNANDSTFLEWDESLPTATFTRGTQKKMKGTFCWTPSASDVRTAPYYVLFKVRDNACPKSSFVYKAFAITVNASGAAINATATAQYNYCTGKADFQSNITSGPGGTYQYEWIGTNGLSAYSSSTSHNYNTYGKQYYTVKISSPAACGDFIKNDSVTIPLFVPISANINAKTDTSACINTPFTLSANTVGGRQPYTYSWNGGAGTSASYTFSPTQADTIKLIVTDSFGCSRNAGIWVALKQLPIVSVANTGTNVCYNGQQISLSASPTGGQWSGSTCVSGNSFNPSNACLGTNQLVYQYTDAQTGCSNTDTVLFNVVSSITSTTGSYGPVCENGNPVQLTGSPSGGTWQGNGVIGNKLYPGLTGGGSVTLTYQASGGCGTLATTNIAVLKAAKINFSQAFNHYCENAAPVTLTATPNGGTWSGNYITNGLFYAQTANTGLHQIKYNYLNPSGCISKDSTVIYVDPLPSVNAGSDNTICKNSGLVALSGFPSSGTWIGSSFLNGSKFNSSQAPGGAYTLTYAFTQGACTNKDSMILNVLEADFSSNITSGNTPLGVGFYNNSSTGFNSYQWNFGDPASGSNNTSVLQNPSHVYDTGGLFTVSLTSLYAAKGCSDTKTKTAYINAQGPNALIEIINNNSLLVFPNPSYTREVKVNWVQEQSATSFYTLKIYNASGAMVSEQQAMFNTDHVLNLPASGIYFVQAIDANGATLVKKVMIH